MLEENQMILQGVLDSMQDMLRVLDLDKRVVLVNKSYQACFGDQVDKRCHDMYGSKSSCRQCISSQAIQSGEPQQMNKRFQGRHYWVNASPLYGDSGAAIGTVEVFRDVTEARRNEARLREENKRLNRDAKLAARLQRELFLSQGQPDGRVETYSRYLPASSIGGDMFGCLRQKDGKLCFYVADVSGHGVAAAMITLFLANIFRGKRFHSAARMLAYAREAFLSMVKDEQLYVSMFAVVLDPDTGALSWANAGLNAVPLLVDGDTLTKLYSPALPICNWEENIVYREHTLHMPENARLLLYTDGLLDKKSSRLTEETLMRRMARMEGEALLKNLERQVLPNRGDDVCMLLITRKSQGAQAEYPS